MKTIYLTESQIRSPWQTPMHQFLRLKSIFLFLLLQPLVYAQVRTADFNYNSRKEYNTDTVQSRNYADEYISHKIVIDGWDSRVPFFLIHPNEQMGRFVILLHGLGSSKDGWIYPLSDLSKKYILLKDSLLNLGFSVIIPDAKYHGERSYEANFTPPLALLTPSNLEMIDDMWITTVKDLRLIMDYVESTNPHDPSFRVVGYSMGGMLALMLNSADERLNSVVACVAPLDLPKVCTDILGWNDTNAAKSLEPISPHNYAKTQLSPVCLLMGKSDPYYSEEEAKAFYNEISLDDKKIEFYESAHHLPSEFVGVTIQWLQDHP